MPNNLAPVAVPAWQPDAALQVLALDTSTSTLSLALGVWPPGAAARGQAPRQWLHAGAGAAQSSATLIPAILQLLAQAGVPLQQLDAIAFGAGPGSFTGLRTACAVAQGLALGANIPVLPMDTLQAVAEDWRSRQAACTPGSTLWSLLDARMQEMYVAGWRWQPQGAMPAWALLHDACLVAPQHLLHTPGLQADAVCAGNVQAEYGAALPLPVAPAMPSASAMLRLAPALLLQGRAQDPALALPRYVRDKVALTTAERAAQAAAK